MLGLRLFLFLAASALLAHAGNTTCADPSVTWYLNPDGENPCQQYERLRRICDTEYEVPTFRTLTPGDNCDSQLKDCCCNSVAWSLSMLCMNCQMGVGTGRPGDNGIDAGAGAYQMYLADCGAGRNQSLPEVVQTQVCDSKLWLGNYLYDLFWNRGDWFYEYTRQRAGLYSTQPNKHCPELIASPSSSAASTSASASSPAQSAQTTPQPSQSASASTTNVGAIAGGIVAGVVALVALLGAALLWYRRRRNRGATAIDLADGEADIAEVRHHPGLVATPYVLPPSGQSSSQQVNESRTHLHAPAKGAAASRNEYAGAGSSSRTDPSWNGPGTSSEGSYEPRPQNQGDAAYQGYPTPAGSRKTAEDSRGAYSTISPSTGYHGSSGVDEDRHVDAGISLGRSMSGRLPPAYPGAAVPTSQ